MGVTELFAATAALVAGCMLALWLLSLALRDASIADIFWGLGFAGIGVLTFVWTNGGGSPRRGLITAGVSLWGLRLAAYLLYLSEEDKSIKAIDLDISKQQLAALLGTIPETLSRILGRLSTNGLIETEGSRIRILDREGLEDLAESGGRLL